MAIDHLQVDTTTIRSLSENLLTVHDALSTAAATSATLASNVGHPGLSSTITDFADTWDDRRAELVKQLETLKGSAISIADAFESVDVELAKALAGEGS